MRIQGAPITFVTGTVHVCVQVTSPGTFLTAVCERDELRTNGQRHCLERNEYVLFDVRVMDFR